MEHEMPAFSHVDAEGKASMVNVGEKSITKRMARAQCIVQLGEQVMAQLQNQELHLVKGPVFQTAILAGIMGAKRTGELIPLCHPLGMDQVDVSIRVNEQEEVVVECIARVTGKTGVEMEALTGASVAALTIYDMCKALSHDILIKDLRLMEKRGGKRDFLREV